MPSQMIRVDRSVHAELRRLASSEGRTMREILAAAVERYRRDQIIAQSSAAYAAVRKDKKAWKQEQAERKQWESTLSDGLSHD